MAKTMPVKAIIPPAIVAKTSRADSNETSVRW